jgi:hypothetical protein
VPFFHCQRVSVALKQKFVESVALGLRFTFPFEEEGKQRLYRRTVYNEARLTILGAIILTLVPVPVDAVPVLLCQSFILQWHWVSNEALAASPSKPALRSCGSIQVTEYSEVTIDF